MCPARRSGATELARGAPRAQIPGVPVDPIARAERALRARPTRPAWAVALAFVASLSAACAFADELPRVPQNALDEESERETVRISKHPNGALATRTEGRLSAEGRWRRHGRQSEYDAAGALLAERFYADDRPIGEWTLWHPNGALRARMSFAGVDVDVPLTWWHDNGARAESGLARNAAREGPWEAWYPDGRRRWIGAFRAGQREGPWILWRPDGSLEARGEYRANRRVGAWVLGASSGANAPPSAAANAPVEPGV